MQTNLRERAIELFKMYDMDQDGNLTAFDLHKLVSEQWHHHISMHDAVRLIHQYEEEISIHLSFDGFLRLVTMLQQQKQCKSEKELLVSPSIHQAKPEETGHCHRSLIGALRKGNQRYRQNDKFTHERRSTARKQIPSFIVISCSDSRCSVPLVFDSTHLGVMFEIKTAGNVLDLSCIESIKYAIMHLEPSPRLILVLGHTHCGAVTACYNSITDPEHATLQKEFPQIMGAIQDSVMQCLQSNSSSENKEWIINDAVRVNAMSQAEKIKMEFEDILQSKKIKVVTAVYDIDTGHVEFGEGVELGSPEVRKSREVSQSK